MSERNPRPDSKLKRLDISIMREVVAMYGTPGVKQADVIAWLREKHGVQSSVTALSQDFAYLQARVRSANRDEKINAWLECEKLEHPELTDEELFQRGQRKFSLLTIAEEDPKGWAMIQKTQRDKEVVSMDRIKLQRDTVELFIKWATDKEAMELATSNAPRADKIEKLGQQMFGELW